MARRSTETSVTGVDVTADPGEKETSGCRGTYKHIFIEKKLR